MTRRPHLRPRAAAFTAAIVCCALASPAAQAKRVAGVQLPQLPIPVHVVFSGLGQFHYDNTAGSHASAIDQLNWDVEYHADLLPHGELTSTSAPPPSTAGDYQFDDTFYEVDCSGQISTVPQAGPFPPDYPDPPPETTPEPTAGGTLIQGVTYLSRNPDDFSNCVGQRGDYDGSGEAADGVSSLLDEYLPGALTARIQPITRQEFLSSGAALHVFQVSEAEAPDTVADSCADFFGIEDPDQCQMSLAWNGTVLIDGTAGCPVILVSAAGELVCMPSQGMPTQAITSGVQASASGPGAASESVTVAGPPERTPRSPAASSSRRPR